MPTANCQPPSEDLQRAGATPGPGKGPAPGGAGAAPGAKRGWMGEALAAQEGRNMGLEAAPCYDFFSMH